MSQMIYPPVTEANAQAEWLQRSVTEYFASVTWAAMGTSKLDAIREEIPLSLDMSVVQYFANFAWGGGAGSNAATSLPPITSEPQPSTTEEGLLDPSMVEDFLDFAPMAYPDAPSDGSTPDDVGSLADLADFF
ncbi:hypothetical protein IQ266_04280 [filamentous cyanobacterium LEGE 11480]|uniref:Uncharacterized protein n=1 Tax=Romeriopsis navalis LEGE 11480 TaxID=2777977 RepID=A0A928VIJ9_9CYAN|nr:hypothetical protein [Romeriopsis navalis]MBE9028980.1 hypothetical protein [Romeriopsis navalis LEGE 11480]